MNPNSATPNESIGLTAGELQLITTLLTKFYVETPVGAVGTTAATIWKTLDSYEYPIRFLASILNE